MSASPQGLSFLKKLDRPALIAMIHVGALPGTPRCAKSVAELCRDAVTEAKMLARAGVDAIMLENMHDAPYLNRSVGPEIVAAMTAICSAVRAEVSLPLGLQILAGANREAVAVAFAADFQFIRCEGFVFAHVADEGLMPEADAGPLLRYRRIIGAQRIAILADIKKKHAAHALTADVDLAETARAAVFSGADAVIVTGTATGRPANADDVASVADAVDEPVLAGSGVTPENLASIAAFADAAIIGSYLKKNGLWENGPDPRRVKAMVKAIRQCRK
ncbi:MAG TPA: BtpA/SgcQ family protein [Phycisphaerae bacterium]|nr:BtpA/SgcQ family protein [Phycisphaerae bacterium]